jgi:S-formylglutathione hydrolase FrmB
MGGEGALQLAINYPGVFRAVGAHTPTTRLSYEDSPGTIYGDEAYWQEHNSLWLIENDDAVNDLEIWIDDGYDDVWLPSAEALHAALLARSIPHQYHVFAGGHDYWEEVLDDYLRFFSGAMDTGGPDATQPSVLRRRAGRPARIE